MLNRILMALLVVTLLSAFATLAKAVTLPDSLETEILILQAAGDISGADSLRKVFEAQIVLAKKQEVAQKKLNANWNKELKPMTYEKVWEWALLDVTNTDLTEQKIGFLVKRYGLKTPDVLLVTYEEQVGDLKAQIEERQRTYAVIDARIKRANGGQNLEKALADLGFSPAVLADIVARIEALESNDEFLAGQILEVRTNMEILRDAVNTNGVNTAACLELLKSCKYDKKLKEADRVQKAVQNADFDPIIFEGVPMESGN